MGKLLEFIVLAVLAVFTTWFIVAITRKRAAIRSRKLSSSAVTVFPCRISWGAKIGKRSSVYGKITAGSNGELLFNRRFHDPISLPKRGAIEIEKSWRPAHSVIKYTTRDGDIHILASSPDIESISGIIEHLQKPE